MYKEELIQNIKDAYREEVKLNEQLNYVMEWIKKSLQDFAKLDKIKELSVLRFNVTDNRLEINGYYLEFKKESKRIKVMITPTLGDGNPVIDEFVYKDGIFVNYYNQPLSNELMDEYLKKAFEGKWDKVPGPTLRDRLNKK